MTNIPQIDFQTLFESAPGLYLVLDPDFKIVAVSDSYLQATMTKRKEILGRGLFEVFPDNPDDLTATGVSNLRSSLNHALKNKITHTMAVQKYDIRRPDGTFEVRHWSPLNKPVLNEKKEVIYIIHRVEDVTEFVRMKEEQAEVTENLRARVGEMEMEVFKRAQELQENNVKLENEINERKKYYEMLEKSNARFHKLFYLNPTAMAINTIVTPDGQGGVFIDLNESFEKLTGYKKEELIGKTSVELGIVSREGRKETVRVMKETTSLRNMEKKLRNKDGHELSMLLSVDSLKIGDTDCIMSAMVDITDRKASEEKIRKLNDNLEKNISQVEAVNKELEAFTYSVSHDLRAPLRIIDGYIEMLIADNADNLDSEGQRTLGIIKSNARRMGILIDDLLNLSRLGRQELNIHRIEMGEFIRSIMQEDIKSDAPTKADIKIGEILPAHCDRNLIRQVWINLISNALKYSKNKETQVVEIGSHKKEKEIVYFIKDNGVGFDMTYADKLFGIFQRLHKMTEFEGTGVGLAIVQRVISKHNGRVWAESEIDKGATFYFSLPVAEA